MVLALNAAAMTVIIVAIVIFVIWAFVFWFVMRDRQSRTPVPPNLKPYLDDDALETRRLERALQWSVVVVVLSAIGLAAIFVWEPTRQADAFKHFSNRAVETGEEIFGTTQPDADGHVPEGAYGCADCHGPGGVGGSTEFTITNADGTQSKVVWSAPALNTVLLRFSEDEVRRIIGYGRPGTPMPPWSVAGGGSMTPEQVENVLAYIGSIQLTADEAKEETADAGITGTASDGSTQYSGAQLFDMFCARCHTAGASYGEAGLPGDGALGPNLRGGAELSRFPGGAADNIEFIAEGSDFEVPYGNQGIGTGRMPGFGQMLSEGQIAAIVAYIRNSISSDNRTGTIVGDTSGTSAQDVDEDVPGNTSTADITTQQIDEGDD